MAVVFAFFVAALTSLVIRMTRCVYLRRGSSRSGSRNPSLRSYVLLTSPPACRNYSAGAAAPTVRGGKRLFSLFFYFQNKPERQFILSSLYIYVYRYLLTHCKITKSHFVFKYNMLYMYKMIIYFLKNNFTHFILKVKSINFLYHLAIDTGLFKTAEWSV